MGFHWPYSWDTEGPPWTPGLNWQTRGLFVDWEEQLEQHSWRLNVRLGLKSLETKSAGSWLDAEACEGVLGPPYVCFLLRSSNWDIGEHSPSPQKPTRGPCLWGLCGFLRASAGVAVITLSRRCISAVTALTSPALQQHSGPNAAVGERPPSPAPRVNILTEPRAS